MGLITQLSRLFACYLARSLRSSPGGTGNRPGEDGFNGQIRGTAPPCASPRHPDDIAYPSSIGFLLIHVGCLAAVWTGVTWRAVALSAMLYLLRMFAIGAGYHRFFRASRLQHRPNLPVRFGVLDADVGATRHSMVGVQAPPAPPILGYRGRRSLVGAARL